MSSAFFRIRKTNRRHHFARMSGRIVLVGLLVAMLGQAAWILAVPGDRVGICDLLVLLASAALAATGARIRGIVAVTRLVLTISFLGSVADRFGPCRHPAVQLGDALDQASRCWTL